MEDREATLQKEVEEQRALLIARAEALRRTAARTFDPREKVKRHPLGGILTSLGVGLGLAFLPGRRRAKGGDDPPLGPNPLLNMAAGFLPGILPALIGPLLSVIGRIRDRKPESTSK